MKKYKVNYYFDGRGSAIVKGLNEKDAENRFMEGLFDAKDDYDKSENYSVDSVELA